MNSVKCDIKILWNVILKYCEMWYWNTVKCDIEILWNVILKYCEKWCWNYPLFDHFLTNLSQKHKINFLSSMKLVTVPQKLFPNPKSNFTICEKNWQWLELVWQRYNCFSIFPIFHFSSRLPPSIDECLWKIARLTLYFCDYEDLTIPLWLNIIKTLPEAQRTQDIESKTWIISKG